VGRTEGGREGREGGRAGKNCRFYMFDRENRRRGGRECRCCLCGEGMRGALVPVYPAGLTTGLQ